MQSHRFYRREFIGLLAGAATWSLAARAQQQPTLPIIGFLQAGSAEAFAAPAAAFREGLREVGYVEGQNVTVDYHWLDGRYDRLPEAIAELIHGGVAVIVTPGATQAALAAKAATATIPIVFAVSEDPVKLGLVASLARPGGNATGINFFFYEIVAKRLGLLHDLLPNAARIGVLVNPASVPVTQTVLRDIPEAARAFGLQVQFFKASTSPEIEAAFATIARERVDALFIVPDSFFTSRRSQISKLAAQNRLPTSAHNRAMVEAGLLMSYGTSVPDFFRQVGIYAGKILQGATPGDLPVLQTTKFEFVINLQTARALGIEVPNSIQLLADEVIE